MIQPCKGLSKLEIIFLKLNSSAAKQKRPLFYAIYRHYHQRTQHNSQFFQNNRRRGFISNLEDLRRFIGYGRLKRQLTTQYFIINYQVKDLLFILCLGILFRLIPISTKKWL